MTAIVLAEPILVGRESELEQLTRYLDSVFMGKGTTVFVSGEAGTGKTRLVREFLELAKKREVNVLSGWCLSDIAVPYFPFMEAFNSYFSSKSGERSSGKEDPQAQSEMGEDEEAEIKAWLRTPKQAGKSERLQNLTPQAWQDLAVAAVRKALLSISLRKPTILFIDDLQWADTASLSLLHYISRSISSARVLVLATYRSEELHFDAEGRPHPLLETMRLMRRDYLLREIRLPNLDQANVASLAEKMVGGSLHPELIGNLAEESQGNPLFVVESLRMLSERGSLVQDGGRWRLSIDEVGIPVRIKDIILRRVGMLKPDQRRILDLASVIGDKFDAELLGVVLGQDSLEVLEILNNVGQSSSLVYCEGSHYEFGHSKSRETIYEQISPPLKRGYHARIAEKIEARSEGTKDLPVNDLAYHYAQAGNKEKAVEYALAAGEDALSRFSNAEAAKHFSHVLATVSDAAEYSGEKTVALEGLGDALKASNRFAEALKTFEELSIIAESGAVKLRALRNAHFCSYWLGDRAHCHELATRAEKYAKYDRLEYARLRLYRGFVSGIEGRSKEAVEDEEWALRVFEEEYSLRDVAAALAEIVFSPRRWGVLTKVELSAALRSVSLYEDLGDLRGQVLAYHRLGGIFSRAGPIFFQEAKNAVDESLRIGEQVGEYNFMALSLWSRGLALERRGARAALAVSLKAMEYAKKTSAYYTQYLCCCSLVRQYALLGEIENAEEAAKKAEKLLDEAGKAGYNFAAAEAEVFGRSCMTYILEAKGQWKDLTDALMEFAEFSGEKGSIPLTAWALDIKRYAWALERQGRIEEARIQLRKASKIEEEARQTLNKLRSRFEHAEVLPYLMTRREIGVDEEMDIRVDLVNVGRGYAKLIKVEGLIPSGFKEAAIPSYCSALECSVVMNEKELGSFAVEPVKLSLRATKAGVFSLSPQVVYVDDLGETKICKPQPVTVTVHPMLHAKIGEETVAVPVLPDHVSTGFAELDALLHGGIPENYAVLLASASTDERALLVQRFIEAGAKAGETTFYVTVEAGNGKALATDYPSSFYLVLCNPQADAIIQNLPNVFKLRGVENLTDIDIVLAKAFRILKPSEISTRRICIEIISDALLQHHAVTTRRWLSALLPTLKSKGFTILGVVDPQMHPPEEVQSILGIFDGEIRVTEKETPEGIRQILRVRKLLNQKYLENELILNKELKQ